MNKAHLETIIAQGEGISVEFKTCRRQLSRDVFESVCAFMNRNGGHLFLGVADNGHIAGIEENANKPHGHGLIDPDTFTPFPKNPIIARVFKEIGLADELGSGVRNVFKYTGFFSNGGNPQFIEDDVFKIIIPVAMQATVQATVQATMQTTMQADRDNAIVNFCKTPRSRDEIQNHIKIKNRDYLRKEILNPLIQQKLLKMTIPDKPNSPNQKYYSGTIEDTDG